MSAVLQQIQIPPAATPGPWSFRVFDSCKCHPVVAGTVVALVMFLAFGAIELLSGRPQALFLGHPNVESGCAYLVGDYRIGIIGIIILAASMTARYVLAHWTHEAGRRLQHNDLRDAEMLASENVWGVLPGAIGIALCLAVAVDIAERDIEWTSAYWIFPHFFNWIWCVPFGWVGGRFIFALVVDALIISRVAERIEVGSLSDTGPLDVVVKHGSRSALVSSMFIGILSVHFVDPGLDTPAMLFLVALFLIGAVFSVFPALGVIGNLYAFRDAQLAHLRAELQIEESQLYARDVGYESGRIADIVAMEQRLQVWKVRVFHFSSVVRLLIYALLGFLSWVITAALSVLLEKMFNF